MTFKTVAGAVLVTMAAACATIPPSGTAPAALVAKEWTVVEVAGQATLPDARPTLLFSRDGRLSGSTSCNRLIATYSVRGSKLAISPAGATLMACPPAVMDQERRFLDVLNGVKSYQVGSSSQLVLSTNSGAAIRAR